jgi:hypothetical protein
MFSRFDARDRECQLHKLRLAELRARMLIHSVRNFVVSQAGDRLGPSKRGAFVRAVEISGLASSAHHIKALLAPAAHPEILGMHVEAERAAVDLRYPVVDELWRQARLSLTQR